MELAFALAFVGLFLIIGLISLILDCRDLARRRGDAVGQRGFDVNGGRKNRSGDGGPAAG
jgi:hypothetical protein